MAENHRRIERKSLEPLYEKQDGNACVYCGDPATTLDHLVPIHFAARLRETHGSLSNWPTRIRGQMKLVPACNQCNSWLGGCLQFTIKSRKKLCLQKIRKKYKRYLRAVVWDEDDLDEMGETLRQYIESEQAKREWVNARIRTLTS